MRNLFDQYNQPENKLTHSLVSCLYEDSQLLNSFLKSFCTNFFNQTSKLSIEQQTVPGEFHSTDDENERKGLPDAVIYAEEQCLIIESKVSSTLTKDQLMRHEKTVRRRGFNSIRGIGIVVDLLPNVRLDNWKQITWNQVYSWAYKQTKKSEWARKLIDYFNVLENNMVENEYLREGSITDWIKYAFAIMHNGSTTAIEATISGKPVLTFNPFKMEYAHDLSNSLGFNINSKDKLLEKANQLFELSKKVNFKIEKVDIPEQLLKKIYIDQNELASEKIIRIWESLNNKNLSKINNWYKFYCLLKILNIKKSVKKILAKVFTKNFKTLDQNHKFPPLIENNIREKVSRIQNVIGIKKKIQCKLLSDRTILIRSL